MSPYIIPGLMKYERIAPEKTIAICCKYYSVSLDDLMRPNRRREVVVCRHMLMYILREIYQMSLDAIARILGKRDHSTVVHGLKTIKKLMSVYPVLSGDFIKIQRLINE
jgi:chromosomal replication initiator protein